MRGRTRGRTRAGVSMVRVTDGQCDGCGWLQTGMNCAVFWKRSEAWLDEDGDCEARRTPTQVKAARGEMATYEAAKEGRAALAERVVVG